MLTPQKPAGQVQSARIKVQVALHALTLGLREAGPMSEDGRAILEAIQKLVKQFGKTEDATKPLMPAEMAAVMSAAQPGRMPPSLASAIKPSQPPAAAAA